MDAAAGAVLFVAAAAALWTAAIRVASRLAPQGLERALAAAPLAVAAAVAEALLLGLADLGGSGPALAAIAILTWLATRRVLPAPELSVRVELSDWLGRAPRPARLAAAGAFGAWAGAVVWSLRHPYLGLDGGTYHLSSVVNWAREGSPGAIEPLYAGVPVANYPLAAEVSIAWAVGLANSLAPAALWTASVAALLVASAWLGLRTLEVPRAVAALAIAALCLVPVVLRGIVQVETDVPALAWLVTAGALGAAAQRRPPLLVAAVVAAFLAVGTKVTVLPLAVVAVAVSAAGVRHELRSLLRPLIAATLLGMAVGGVWYLRNLVDHGSPLWPFVTAPWGDPVPPVLDRVDFSLLERPRETLEGKLDLYRAVLSGGLVLLAGALLAPSWAPRRRVVAAAGVTLFALVAWAAAPLTGEGAAPFLQLNTVRYLIPALAVAALTVALTARARRRGLLVAGAVLAGAVVWSARSYAQIPYLPAEWQFLLVSALVAGLALAAAELAPRLGVPGLVPLGACLAAVAALLAISRPGYAERSAAAGDFHAGLITWFEDQPEWRDGASPVAFSPVTTAVLAGERQRHPVRLIELGEPCARVRARVREGWVVVRDADRRVFGPVAAEDCLRGVRPRFTDGIFRVYGGEAGGTPPAGG